LLEEGAGALDRELRVVFGNRVFGPEYPMVSRIRNQYLNQFILKNEATHSQKTFKSYLLKVIDKFREYTKYRSIIIQLDVDPM
jgi:primosomal protein N' (replication factor Y)